MVSTNQHIWDVSGRDYNSLSLFLSTTLCFEACIALSNNQFFIMLEVWENLGLKVISCTDKISDWSILLWTTFIASSLQILGVCTSHKRLIVSLMVRSNASRATTCTFIQNTFWTFSAFKPFKMFSWWKVVAIRDEDTANVMSLCCRILVKSSLVTNVFPVPPGASFEEVKNCQQQCHNLSFGPEATYAHCRQHIDREYWYHKMFLSTPLCPQSVFLSTHRSQLNEFWETRMSVTDFSK